MKEKYTKTELFEKMPVGKALLTMAIPTVISQLITMIYNMADTVFIGMSNDPNKVAAASVVGILFFMLNALSNLFGVTYDSRMTVGRDVLGTEEAISLWPDYSWVTEKGSYLATGKQFTPFEGAEIPEGYVERINSIVTNKVKFSRMVQNAPFFTKIQEELNKLQ